MKLSSKLEILSESAGCFTGIGVLFATLAGSQVASKVVEYLVINQVYGHAVWLGGLRISDGKHAGLSNGDFLSGWPYVVFVFGTFLLMVPFFFGSFFLLSYIGLRLRGRHLSGPQPNKPKKKWRSSGESDYKGD